MTENPVDDQTPGAGSTPPSYDAPAPQAPGYGSPQAPTYGSPQPAAPQYGAPQQPQYGAPQPPYGAPQQPQQQFGGPQGFGGSGPVSDSDRKTWSMLAHLGGIVLSFVAPLVIWLLYKDRDEFVKEQSLEALNFQITVIIASFAVAVLSVIGIGFLLFPFLWIGNLVFCILAGMAANRGERYRYPVSLRVIS